MVLCLHLRMVHFKTNCSSVRIKTNITFSIEKSSIFWKNLYLPWGALTLIWSTQSYLTLSGYTAILPPAIRNLLFIGDFIKHKEIERQKSERVNDLLSAAQYTYHSAVTETSTHSILWLFFMIRFGWLVLPSELLDQLEDACLNYVPTCFANMCVPLLATKLSFNQQK